MFAASEPPHKKRKYVPGGPGGGGRFIDDENNDSFGQISAAVSAPRPRTTTQITSPIMPRRERSSRIRTAANRSEPDEMEFSSAAAVAAAVVQSEGYKPREERGWEEFHPNLDIEATFMIFHSEDVDGIAKSTPPTPSRHTRSTPMNGVSTPSKDAASGSVVNTPNGLSNAGDSQSMILDTTPRRRVGRPPRESASLYAIRPPEIIATPRTPKVLPIHNQTPKERLDLKQPSYRKTDRILLFESKTFGQARYVEKAMMNVGYQESDNFIRPERKLIKASDSNLDEDLEQLAGAKADGDGSQPGASSLGRVEYDMDEQDDVWLESYNTQRKANDLEPITREIFEITITKIEKEWHALEKRIPKPNPKPPQTHRPRSSSAAAVNGETQVGEEQDSKCAICDDGDCENTNAIVFCDGCDLAVHQECYGVPFIPEGQWMCRKCQLAGRGIPTCIFCPNTDGAFKQTNSSKWAHLLCAMWIPEVSLGNHTFMEPVMDVEKVPKNRWKLTCYICNQRMGACIQCGNKSCYQAFHVTCARRAHLYLKMKNSQGALAVLDGSMVLKAFCDRHCPPDYTKENSVSQATREAKRFYKKTMKGRIWATSQASAQQIAATHRHAITEHPPDESQMIGAKLNGGPGDKNKGQGGKVWKLPSGAPVIPQAVFDLVEYGLQRFTLRKRKEFVGEACRYWTLKREARRGAALLKRLQLQMETFSSMELTRRNFVAMGPSGKARLQRRIEFAETLMKDLEQLKHLSEDIVKREVDKLEQAEMEQDFVDTTYFPVYKLFLPVIEKAQLLDKNVFQDGLAKMQTQLDARFYTTTLAFAHDLCEVINVGINGPSRSAAARSIDASPTKHSTYSEARDRKRLGKRILKAVQQQLESALRAEADITSKPLDTLLKELDGMIEASLELRQLSSLASHGEVAAEASQDVIMVDAPSDHQITVADGVNGEDKDDSGDPMDVEEDAASKTDNIKVKTASPQKGAKVNGTTPSGDLEADGAVQKPDMPVTNGVDAADTPPGTNGYVPVSNPAQAGPLTPPQSNGSLGRGPTDTLTEGGIPWYLKPFDIEGTTAVEEQWAGRDALRALSEELTDMDDDELNDLEFNVEDSTITASPINAVSESAPSSSSKKKGSANKVTKRLRQSTRRR